MRAADPALVLALHEELSHHVGRERAVTWEYLRLRVEGYPYRIHVPAVRRVQEAAAVLLDHGVPIVGLSSCGVFVARTVDELDAALAETERRARTMLARRRRLRRARLAMMGQGSLMSSHGESSGAASGCDDCRRVTRERGGE